MDHLRNSCADDESTSRISSVVITQGKSGLVEYGNNYSNCITNNYYHDSIQSAVPNTTNGAGRNSFIRTQPELSTPVSQNTSGCRNYTQQNICGGKNNQNTDNDYCYHNRGSLSRWWSDATPNIKSKLKNSYKNATLPRVSWMEKGNDLKLDDFYAELQLDLTGEIVGIETIFSGKSLFSRLQMASQNKMPRRILIEGQPGFGKTTLASKLAFDWAVGANYMKSFALVFILQLKEILNETITTGITREAHKCDFHDDDGLQNAICSNGSKVLIILDGFDELPHGTTRDCVLKVLYKMNYSEAIVIVTCRNGMFQVDNEELTKICPTVAKRIQFWDRKLNVIGLDQVGKRKLLTKFLSPGQANDILAKLQSLCDPISDFFKCPLILMLLGFLYDKGELVEFNTTKTKLYKAILNGLAKYNIARQSKSAVDENSDLFAAATNSSAQDLYQFGKICFRLVAESKYDFEDNDLIERIYKIGFLSKIETKTAFKTTFHFESIHRSFIEFYAAYYISQELEMAEKKRLIDDVVQTLHRIFFDTRGTSLVLPFLVGMMESQVHLLLNQLSPRAHLYSRIERGLWRLLEECQLTQEAIESFTPFIPPLISSFAFTFPNFIEFLKRTKNERPKMQILSVLTCKNETYNCPPRIHFERIIVELTSDSLREEVCEKYSRFFHQVSCSSTRFVFLGTFANSENNQKGLSKWFKIFEKLKADKLLLYISETTTCSLLFSCLKLGTSFPKSIDFLHCVLNDDGAADWMEFVLVLLQRNYLHCLRFELQDIRCSKTMKMETILNCASRSKLLSSLTLNGYFSRMFPCVVDLQRLSNNGLKDWDYLYFFGIKVIKTIPTANTFQVNELVIFTTSEMDDGAAKGLLNSQTSVLHCDSRLLFRLQEMSGDCSKNEIFTSVTELILIFDEECWENLKNFTRIEKLAIHFDRESSTLPDNLIFCLQSMNIDHLEIRCQRSSFKTTAVFIQQLVKSFPWKLKDDIHPITRLDVFVWNSSSFTLCELVSPLLDCLERKFVTAVGLSWNSSEDCNSESFAWVDANKFTMEPCILGLSDDDWKCWRRSFNNGAIRYKMNVQLRQSKP